MVVVALIGIAATFALTSYQSHLVRTRIVEGLQLAEAARYGEAKPCAAILLRDRWIGLHERLKEP